MEKISFIIPSRDNLKYLKWAYEGLRKNCSQEHQICMADDASTDGTWEWMVENRRRIRTYPYTEMKDQID